MKKGLAAGIVITVVSGLIFSGCEADKGLETENLKIAQYKDVEVDEVEKPEKVTDEDVENRIQTLLDSKAETTEIKDRAVKEGDIVDIDFVGKINGKEFENGSAQGYSLEIGSDSFIDGFEDSIVGHNVKDTFDWEGKFPDDYANADYAGKDVVFTITVNGITQKDVPELDDAFVKSVSDVSKTVEEYKKEVKKDLEESSQNAYLTELGSEVWQKIVDSAEVVKYPEKDVKELKDKLISQYKEEAKAQKKEYEEYLKDSLGTTEEDLEKQAQEVAESTTKQRMILNAIAEKENIKLTDEEYKEQLQNIADMYGITDLETLEKLADEDELKEMALLNVVVAWLGDNCIQKAAE